MLTDDGFVRMEWSRGDTDFTAEIGPDSLWFCVLGSDPNTDDSIELAHFDRFRLETFFNLGKLR
ncbi:hypothetical protein [Mycobacteroides chelonae]|uniref:hypothetical protein n=1 Tax=Mycobacteroides chelonae TaxID=1774 RepID=UPI003AAB4EAE